MYKKFFGLRDNPFNVSPDPRFLFQTGDTREALAGLTYGIQKRQGFILLTGEVGTGKTTLLNRMLQWMQAENVHTSFVPNPRLNPTEFLDFMMADFGIPCESALKSRVLLRLNHWLLELYRSGETAVLVVDEAQNLSTEVLEEIRLLTNLETATEKLLQIVLCGQPELEEMLKQPQLRQLRQRISLRLKIRPLTHQESSGYIAERLRIAGGDGQMILTAEAVEAVDRYAQGIPRVINMLCEHALITAYAEQRKPVAAETIEQVARQFELDDIARRAKPLRRDANADQAAQNASPNRPQPHSTPAKTDEGVAPDRSVATNARPVYQAHPGIDRARIANSLRVASVAGPTLSPKEPAQTTPYKPVASPVPAGVALAKQPSPSPKGKQPAHLLFNNITAPAKPWPPKGLTILWVFLTLAMAGGLGGILYFSRLPHQAPPFEASPVQAPTIRPAAAKAEAQTLSTTGGGSPTQPTDSPQAPPLVITPAVTAAKLPVGPSLLEGQTTKVKEPSPNHKARQEPGVVKPSSASKVGQLVVSANVEGARISVDGRSDPHWLTPHTFAALPSGAHLLLVSKEGFEEAYLNADIKAGGANSVKAHLEILRGRIQIVTNPPGLEVSIDGGPYVPSPVELEVKVGEHSYTIKRPGFEEYKARFTVKDSSVITDKVDFSGKG